MNPKWRTIIPNMCINLPWLRQNFLFSQLFGKPFSQSSHCADIKPLCFSAIFMAYINVLAQNGLKNSTHSRRADVEHFKVAITLWVLSRGQASRWVLECVCGNICTAVTSDSLQLSLSASPDIMIIWESPTWPNPLLNSSQGLMFSRNCLVSNNHWFVCFQVCVHYFQTLV